MARILVAGPGGLGARPLMDSLVARLRADGHDATLLDPADARAVDDADALVAVLDPALAPVAAATVGHAAAAGKPVLGLHDGSAPALLLEACTRHAAGHDLATLVQALPAFYDDMRPFAGRLVRDNVPRLVEEAGHDVSFRELDADERPRFLKQKVHEEAKALLASDRGTEPDEIADLLEALEALIKARGFDREDLRRVKEGKLRRRGGFEKGYVVEATAQDAAPEPEAATQDGPDEPEPMADEPRSAEPAAGPTAEPAAGPQAAPRTDGHEPHAAKPPAADPQAVAPGQVDPQDGPDAGLEADAVAPGVESDRAAPSTQDDPASPTREDRQDAESESRHERPKERSEPAFEI